MSADLVRDLERLGDELAWPETPDLAPGVVARLAEPRRTHRRLVLAVVVAVLVPATGAVAFPDARDDVLDWLGLKSVEVRREPTLPAARPAAPNALGEQVSLEEAARRLGAAPVLPPALGDPREARERDGVVTLVYGGGIRLAQLRGALDRQLLTKIVTSTEQVRAVPEGVFIEGRHVYFYRHPDGTVTEARTTGTTLIAERGNLLLRLEGATTYAAARDLLKP